MENELKAWELKVVEIDARSKSNSHRIDEMHKKQEELEHKQSELGELTASVKVLATKQETVESDVKEIKNDVKNISLKPAKRWDGVVDKAVWLIIGGLLSLLLSQTGINI